MGSTRRAVLGTAAAGVLTAIVPAGAAAAPVRPSTPRLGFSGGGLHADQGIDQALKDVEAIAALGGTVIRFGFGNRELLRSWGEGEADVVLDTAAADAFHRIIDRAHALDMDVIGMVIDTFHDQAAPDDLWWTKTTSWWRAVAAEFAGDLEVVQIFNEAGAHHYRFHEGVVAADLTAYHEDLAAKLTTAASIFHRQDPDVLVTTNLYGWPVGDGIEQEWTRAFDVIAPALDLLTVDVYFDHAFDDEEYPAFAARLQRLADRYDKPVAIGEIGDSTLGDAGREKDQARHYRDYVDLLSGTVAAHVVFYEFRDAEDDEDSESTFGIIDHHGNPKPAFDHLTNHPLP